MAEPQRRGFLLISAVVIAAVALADVFTGEHLTMSAFYAIAVMSATWAGGRAWGFVAVALAGVAGFFSELLVSEPYLHLQTPYALWISVANAVSRVFVYSTIVLVGSGLQRAMAQQARLVAELQQALAEIRTLRGLLPMCAWCKKVRDEEDQDRWKSFEQYVAEHADVSVTHGICPDCLDNMKKEHSLR